MRILIYTSILTSLFLLFSCATAKVSTVPIGNRNSNNKFVKSSELYTPIYAPNGGSKRETIFNRSKVVREKEVIALINSIPKPREAGDISNTSSEADIALKNAIETYNKKIYELEKKLSQIDMNSKGYEEDYTNLSIELNNLICNYQEGLDLMEKKVQKLFGDISFQTGSSEISGKGKLSIKEIANNVTKEVEKWRKYVNTCNKKIFEDDLFVVVINIDGYADQRGSEPSNLTLSKKRSQSVEKLIRGELVDLVKKQNIKIVFDKIYAEGYGEKLPPGVQQGPEDDPNRRVCVISYLVCPARYLGE
jgi:outer membrane protein OmpA-like peptidoglycan-associated protein